MLLLQKKVSAWAAACLLANTIAVSGAGASPTSGSETTARITAEHGEVFKRDFVDWNREVWGEPEPAKIADTLREGMQIGTGNDSWAEVTWPNVKTRAWENTVFAVAPNKRLVYLTGGEMLFRLDKHRKDMQPYFIWTKVLQARIRGTTVLVQTKGDHSRITVMEGKIDIFNRLDHSTVTITPGVICDIKGCNISTTRISPMPSLNGVAPQEPKARDNTLRPGNGYKPSPISNSKFEGVQDICYDSKAPVPLFQDNDSMTKLFAANSNGLISHPLVSSGGTIDSLPLMQKELAGVPGYDNAAQKQADSKKLQDVVCRNVEVRSVPSTSDYFVGGIVGKDIKLPQSVSYIPPKGTILPTPQTTTADARTMGSFRPAPPMGPAFGVPPVPVLNPVGDTDKPLQQSKPFGETETAPTAVPEDKTPTSVTPQASGKLERSSIDSSAFRPVASLEYRSSTAVRPGMPMPAMMRETALPEADKPSPATDITSK